MQVISSDPPSPLIPVYPDTPSALREPVGPHFGDESFAPKHGMLPDGAGPVPQPEATEAHALGLATNQILGRLPERHQGRLRGMLETVTLRPGQLLVPAGTPFKYVYFINSGVVSVVNSMRDGGTIEVGMIGSEGLVGGELVWGCPTATHGHVVVVGGNAHRLPADCLTEQLRIDSLLWQGVNRFQGAFCIQAMQGAACIGLHRIGQRISRWLLMCHDRMQTEQIPLTHSQLGKMLSVRRSTITEFLYAMLQSGRIHYARGMITIHDRAGLEAASCECYRVVTAHYRRLLG